MTLPCLFNHIVLISFSFNHRFQVFSLCHQIIIAVEVIYNFFHNAQYYYIVLIENTSLMAARVL